MGRLHAIDRHGRNGVDTSSQSRPIHVYNALLKGAHGIVQGVNMDGSIQFVNDAWHELLGYSKADLEELNLFDVIHPDHHEHCRELMKVAVEKGELENVSTVFVGADGREVAVEGSVSVRYHESEPMHTVGIWRDVTEQRAAQALVQELLTRNKAIVRNAPVGIVLYGQDGRCVEVNEVAARQIGATREQMLQQNFREIESWQRHGLLARAEEALQGHSVVHHEARVDSTFGRQLQMHLRFVGLEVGAERQLLLISEDITKDREREQALLQYQRRLLHVQRIAVDIGGVARPEDLLQQIIESSRQLVDAEFGVIATMDTEAGGLKEVFTANYPMDRIPAGTNVQGLGILGRVAGGHAVHTDDVRLEPGFGGFPPWHPEVGPMLGLPIGDGQGPLAMMLLAKPPGDTPFSAGDRSLLEAVGSLAAVAIRSSQQYQALAEMSDKLEKLATTDALTGIGNRRSFEERIERLHAESIRHGHAYGVLMIDVDQFKSFNDRYGHPAGDECLARVADSMRSSVRLEDGLYRYGGEEFVVIARYQGRAGLRSFAERLRSRVEAKAIGHDGVDLGVVTVSVGGALVDPKQSSCCDQDWRSTLQHADDALYDAKKSGRNRVVIR